MSKLEPTTATPGGAPSQRTRLFLLAVIVTAVSTLVFLGLFTLFQELTRQQTTPASGISDVQGGEDFDGSTTFNPPRVVADFTLTSNTGSPLSLSSLRGTPVLLFFGFTHCPDVCPLTMEEFLNVRAALGDNGDSVRYVFVSVDGTRDTPEELNAFFQRRGVDFVIGLTGPEEQVRQIGQDYNLYFARTEGRGTEYLIEHTSSSFLLDSEGRLVMKFAFQSDPQIVAGYISQFMG